MAALLARPASSIAPRALLFSSGVCFALAPAIGIARAVPDIVVVEGSVVVVAVVVV
jgi:hypothetical protein